MDIKYSGTITEPLTAVDVKNYLKIDFATDDTLIALLITGCRELAEMYCGRSFVVKTVELFMDYDYEDVIELPYPDHNAVTAVTQNGDDILADCIITGNVLKTVKLPQIYGSPAANTDGVKITYTTLANCPAVIKTAILKSIAEMYEKRGNSFEGSIATLSENAYAMLAPYIKL